MFGFDPEVPAGYQDADIEMLEMREAANDQRQDCREGNHRWFTDTGNGYTYCLNCSADRN